MFWVAHIAWLSLAGWIAPPTAQASPQSAAEPLVPGNLRQKLRTVTTEIAKTGEVELVTRMRSILIGLGDDADDLEKLEQGWRRTATTAKPGRSTRSGAATRLRRELVELADQFEGTEEPRRSELARWLLELDTGLPAPNQALGRSRTGDGPWLTTEERRWKLGAEHCVELTQAAGRLEFEIEHGASDNPALLQLLGHGNRVRARGIELHSALPPDELERILRQALRAAALSHGMLHDALELPRKLTPRRFLLLDSAERYRPALDEARAQNALSEEGYREILDLDLRSFADGRGWVSVGWRSEVDLEALILWHMLADWLGANPQPCLRAGHLNWVCLSFLGTSIPWTVWFERGSGLEGHSTALRDEAFLRQSLLRCARQSLVGCRSWMTRAVREDKDPPWARSMLDQEGKIRDENLFKTTLVCEWLQIEGRLSELIEATRGKPDPIGAVERALGEKLPDVERRWRRWFLPDRREGVLQALERAAPAPAGEPGPFAAALHDLNQARANALAGQSPEIPIVALEPDLCRAAELHARYLTLNPEQKGRWPLAHEEHVGAPGFSVEGSLSAGRSVIHYGATGEQAIQDWLGTFYHRLPLLNPGLFGVGFGASEEVLVLDAGSLVLQPWRNHSVVWPVNGAVDVPLRFVPEHPNPVPAADMASLGYPVTLQLYIQDESEEPRVEMELHVGDGEAGERVDCHFVAPQKGGVLALSPRNAWGLIPKRALAAETRYAVRASWGKGSISGAS